MKKNRSSLELNFSDHARGDISQHILRSWWQRIICVCPCTSASNNNYAANRGVSWFQSYVCIPDDPRLSSAAPSSPACTYRTWDRPRPACTRIDRFPGCRCRTRCRAGCSRINSGSPRRPGRGRRFSRLGSSRATSPRTLPPEYRELKKTRNCER